MSLARVGIAILSVVVALATARAQPAADSQNDNGFIGRAAARLEIDDCQRVDPTATPEQLKKQGSELYQRGVVLYEQGDYPGAVREFVSAYCTSQALQSGANPFYTLLKNIGQAYERNLDYEKAVDYFDRFVRELPAGADPAEKRVVESRVTVLRKLRAHVFVETSPGGANITISNDIGVAGYGRSGKEIEVPGGKYTMLVELAGHEPHTQEIEVRIGKPFAFFVPLRPLRGRLSVQVTPPDAKVFLRDRSVERFVGIGRVDEVLPTGTYVLVADASDRLAVERPIEVLPNRVNRMQIDLPFKPQFGRRQLIAFATVGGAYSSAGLLAAFRRTEIATLGLAVGAGVGLFGSYFALPDQVPLGTSNLTITAGLAGTIAGIAGTRVFTEKEAWILPIQGATTLLGAGVGYYLGDRTQITPGDAALITSSVGWGTIAGGLFALSFASDGELSAGLVLSGFGMGATSGILMARYFDVSRRRTILIDIGGLLGMIGGLAAQNLVYPDDSEAADEHIANFMLGGVAVGLIGAGILTRSVDAPRIPVKPAIVTTTTSGGARTTVYGISASW